MEYQNIINLLDDTTNRTSKFRSNYDYSDAYILVERTIKLPNTAAAVVAVNNTNKKETFENFDPLTDCVTDNK